MVQFFPTASDVPQLLVCVKSPVATMLLMLRAAVPVLDRVIGCAALVVPSACVPKVSDAGLSAAFAVPVPIPTSKMTCCGLPKALSEMITLPLRDQICVGEKVTLMV